MAESTQAQSTAADAGSPDLVGAVKFSGRSILSVLSFTRFDLAALFALAERMKARVEAKNIIECAKGRIMASIFYEPSTRTNFSFQSAFLRLGGHVLSLGDVGHSSVSEGETLGDTIVCMGQYADVIVMRHPNQGAATEAASVSPVPIINAGDGVGEHPTQALLDLFTIQQEAGQIDGINITIIGDLKNGRTVHSLVLLLLNYNVSCIHLISPPSLRLPAALVARLQQAGVRAIEGTQITEEIIKNTNILYVTRVQKERFTDQSEYLSVCDSYVISPALLDRLGASPSLRVLHPLPRVNEITKDMDSDPRAAYVRQMKNGLYVRMALLSWVLGVSEAGPQ